MFFFLFAEMGNPRKRYREYLTSPDAKAPRTTEWRNKKRSNLSTKDQPLLDEPAQNGECQPQVNFGFQEHDEFGAAEPETDPTSETENGNDDDDDDDENVDYSEDDDYYEEDEDDISFDDIGDGQSEGEVRQPLYAGANISTTEFFMLFMTFAIRHSLNYTALNDLLALMKSVCPSPNNIVRTIKKIWDFLGKSNSPKVLHFYCSACQNYLTKDNKPQERLCPKCEKPLVTEYFVQIPLQDQLKQLFKDPDIFTKLRHRFQRQTQDNVISDVYDGLLYKNLWKDNGFFSKITNISFQLNSDGVSLFNSTKISVWPIYLSINELSPKLRFSRDYRIFAGLWFGTSKPAMTTFLQPLCQELFTIYENGVSIEQSDGTHHKIRAILLSACFDAPAKCMFQDFTQFNGLYGCGYCREKGETVPSGNGHTRTYPFNLEQDSGHAPRRTHEETKRDAVDAHSQQRRVNGVNNNFSWGLVLPEFDVIRGVTVDYMHAVLLGVVKMLMSLWFLKAHSKEPWSCCGSINLCDKKRQSITPPDFIHRIPRNIEQYGQKYKASEYRTWLLFYMYPVMLNILPMEYLHHALLLSNAIFILLQQKITTNELQEAKRLIQHFCLRFKDFYKQSKYTYNVHQLLHLADCVTDLGPLWAHSCFFYEDLNGDLRNFFHGSNAFHSQIASATFWLHEINLFEEKFSTENAVKLYKHLTKTRSQLPTTRSVYVEETIRYGKSNTYTLTEDVKRELETLCCDKVIEVQEHQRFSINGILYHTEQYKRSTKRNCFTVQLDDNTVATIINCLCVIYFCGHAECLNGNECKEYRRKVVLSVKILENNDTKHPKSSSLAGPMALMKHVQAVAPNHYRKSLISPSEIKCKLFYAKVSFNEAYTFCQPNINEKD